MKNHSKLILSALSFTLALNLYLPINAEPSKTCAAPKTATVQKKECATVSPLELVNRPSAYLNKKIKFLATFDKFSTIGLDYKPAFRDSQKYISFLIKRPDVTDHTIPLSELKLMISREKAEKLIDLESGDKIEVSGEVFSTSLNDPWVEVSEVKILSPKKSKENKDKKTEKK